MPKVAGCAVVCSMEGGGAEQWELQQGVWWGARDATEAAGVLVSDL